MNSTTTDLTDELFREDAYLQTCTAQVIACDERGIQLDRTLFYPNGGGQPGDTGTLSVTTGAAAGRVIEIVDTVKDRATGEHLHCTAQDVEPPAIGDTVSLQIDWDRRFRLMRMHSCMHMLCAIIPAPVTGGSIQDGRGRLDFDLPDPIDKQWVTDELKRLVEENHPMSLQWITDDELDQQPDLVRTMSVQPPRGAGRIRLVHFQDVDLQPCGGTHVAATGEIGSVRVQKIEKKGKQNRRVIVVFDE